LFLGSSRKKNEISWSRTRIGMEEVQGSPRARGGRFKVENGNPLLAYAKRIGSRYQARGAQ
jgi:hypothetical protein